MVPFDVVKLLFETVTPLFKRMEGGVTVFNEFNKKVDCEQSLSFPRPPEVTAFFS